MRKMRGVTLSELMVVLGLFAFILACGSVASLQSFTSANTRGDQELLVGALLLARSRAQSGKCDAENCTHGQSHGVFVSDTTFTVFEGNTYSERDPHLDFPIPRASSAPYSGMQEFVFLTGSGMVITAGVTEFGTGPWHRVRVRSSGAISESVWIP